MMQWRTVCTALLGLTVSCLMLASCAKRQALPIPDNAPVVWEAFVQRQERLAQKSEAFSLKASLRVTRQHKTNRLVMRFWGQREDALRMDIQAGVGAPLAYVAENASGLTVYYPSEAEAFIVADTSRALSTLGLSLPFSLRDLARLLTGSMLPLLPDEYATAALDSDTMRFGLGAESRIAEIAIKADGTPASLSGPGDAWRIDLTYPSVEDPRPDLPKRVNFVLDSGESGVLLIKDVTYREQPWPEDPLRLDLPEGTQIFHASNHPEETR
jgi:outer membrane biogenesis lipoprotein LolB